MRDLKKIVVLFFACAISVAAAAQTVINNTRTKQHKNIPGTNYFVIPPPSFEESPELSGFKHSVLLNVFFFVVETELPYQRELIEYHESILKAKKIEQLTRHSLKINGRDALYLELVEKEEEHEEMINFILIVDVGNGALKMMGYSPRAFYTSNEPMKASMLSVYFDVKQVSDPFAKVSFTINTAQTNLKIMIPGADAILFGTPADPVTKKRSSTFIVKEKEGGIIPADQQKFCLKSLMESVFTDIKFSSIAKVSINNMNGYQMEATAKDLMNSPVYIQQIILFTKNMNYTMLLSSSKQDEETKKIFRKVTSTFTLK